MSSTAEGIDRTERATPIDGRWSRLGSELGGGPYALALLALHFYFAAYAMSIVAVPQSLKGEADWLVGLVVGALGISGMLTRPLVGVAVDGGRRKRWQRIGAVGTVLAFVGYAVSPNPWVTIVFRLMHGIAMGLFTTAQLAIVSGMLTEHRRGLGMGLYQSANAISQMYASPLAVAIAVSISFPASFTVAAGFSLLAFAFGIFIRDPDAGSFTAAPRPWRQRTWISRPALVPAFVFLSATTTVGAIQAFLPLFALERDLGNVGLFYSVFGFSLLVARAASGALSDRIGRAQVVLPSLALTAVSLFLIANAQSQAMLLATAVIYGLAFAAVQVTVVALVVDRTPVAGRGAGAATYTMAWDVGAVLGGVLLGLIIERTSYSFGFLLCAFLPLAGLVLYIATMRRPPRPDAPALESVEASERLEAPAAGDVPGA